MSRRIGINHRVNIRNSSFVHGGSTTSAVYGGALNDDGSTKTFKLHMSDSALDGNNNGILDVSRTNYRWSVHRLVAKTATAWPQTHLGDPANPSSASPSPPGPAPHRLQKSHVENRCRPHGNRLPPAAR
jgi:hypothetical protein